MQALRALFIFALLTLAGSLLLTTPSCKTAEECYEKDFLMNNKPYKKACESVHVSCRCIPLPVPGCRNPKQTDCPTSLQCHSRYGDNCEKDSDCQKSIKSCTRKNPCICVSRIP